MPAQNVVVIGSGVAGLATAARLAAKGFNVSVFEKNTTAGGKIGLLEKEGYHFDTGPSLFTQPHLLEQLFSYCGKSLSNYLQYQPIAIGCHYFYEDGTYIVAYNELQLFANEIASKLNIPKDGLLRFAEEVRKMYQDIGSIFLNKPLNKKATWLSTNTLKALRTLKLPYLFSTMHGYHKKKLQHPHLVQLFDRFATYNGSSPFVAPAMLCMIAHLELNEGAYYPSGGMISIAEALYMLCKDMGVTFHFNAEATKIIVQENTVQGIIVNSVNIPADVVVSNSDVYFTYKNLLADTSMTASIKKQERSSSAVIFYWGICKEFPQLDLHNILFAENYEAEFNAIFNKKELYTDPTVYINITSKMESRHAPDGCENWFVLVNVPAAAGNEMIPALRAYVIEKVNRILKTDIEQLIATETILTPSLIESGTGSYMGALYGTSSNNRMAAFMRHSNRPGKYKGLFFTGGTVHPGGGIPLCLRSAILANNAVLTYYG